MSRNAFGRCYRVNFQREALMLNLNSPQFFLTATTTSQSIVLATPQISTDTAVITNNGSVPIFAVSGTGSVTAVFPTSSTTVFSNGSIVPPGQTIFFKKNANHELIALIAQSSSAEVAIKIGADV